MKKYIQQPKHATMNETFLKKLDIALLIFFPIFATAAILTFRLNYLWANILFFGFPAAWLSLRTQDMVARTALFCAIFTIPFAFVVNYLAVTDGAWYIPSTVFSFRIFGVVPIEDVISTFLLTYSAVICYEHFLDKGKHQLIDRKMKYFIWPVLLLLIVFFAIFTTDREILKINYAYLWIGILFLVLPLISTLSFFPKLFSKYLKVGAYFAIVLALYEYTGLTLNHWVFPGEHFIGWLPFFGYAVPIEEMVFWILLSVIGVLSYYEFFDDDLR